MKIEYKLIKDAIYNTIISQSDNRFVFNHADRYINQIFTKRYIPNPPFPVILIYKSRKAERHEVLGYAPHPYLYYNIRILDRVPNSQEPDALMNTLGIAGNGIADFSIAEDAIDEILKTLEEWLRADDTPIGKERRMLGIPPHVSIALPGDVNWGVDQMQNHHRIWADLTLELRLEKIT